MKRTAFITLLTLVLPLAVWSQGADEGGQLDFADGLFARGFHADAAAEYERYLNAYPEGAGRGLAWLRLGLCRVALKDLDKGLAAFEKAAAEATDESVRQQARLRMGATQLNAGMNKEAAETLSALVKAEPAPAGDVLEEAYYQLAKAQSALEQTGAALKTFDTLIKKFPEGRFADFSRYQIAFVRLKAGELEAAAIAFTQVADRGEANPQLRMDSIYRAAEAYDRLGWFEPAIKSYERLMREFPDSEYAAKAVYGHAWAMYHAGRYADALRKAEEFLAAHPEDPRRDGLTYLVANCYQQQKRYEDALAAYQGIETQFAESPYAIKAAAKKAWSLHFLKRNEEAMRTANAFMNSHPQAEDAGETAYLLGELHRENKQYRDASVWFGRVHKEYPGNPFAAEALYKLAECNALSGAWAEAALGFDVFIETYPENALASNALTASGDAYMKAGDFAKAAERYTRRLEGLEDGATATEIRYRLAVAQYNAGNADAATALFTELAVEGNPYRAEAERRIGDDLLRRKKDAVAAIEHFQRALELEPEGPAAGETKKGMALARFEAKDWDGAAATFLDVMEKHGSVSLNADTYVWTGQHFFDNGAPEKAARAWSLLLERAPDYANAARVRFSIAEAWEQHQDWAKAQAAYQTVVDTAPQSALALEANFRIARSLEEQGKTDEAMAMYAAAAQTDTGDTSARARLRMGEILSAQSKPEDAAREFMRVGILFLDPEYSPEGLFRAAESYTQAGDSAQAKASYEELLRDYPDSPRAAEARARLDALQAD